MRSFLPRLATLLALITPASALDRWLHHTPAELGGSYVEVSSHFSELPRMGYAPVQITVANREERSHQVELTFQFRAFHYSDRSMQSRASYAIDVPAGTTVVREVLVPIARMTAPLSGYGNQQMNVQLTGSMGDDSDQESNSEPASDVPPALFSETLFEANEAILKKTLAKSSSSSSSSSSRSADGTTFTPDALPSDWRGFSGFEVMALTATDWNRISPPSKEALLTWLRFGGRLIVATTTPQSDTPTSLGLPSDLGFGSVCVEPTPEKFSITDARWKELISSQNPVRSLNKSLTYDYLNADWPLRQSMQPKSFNQKPFIVVLVMFALLVGPLNLFFFARSGQRHRLFITTPLMSLGACLLLMVLILLVDGIGGSGKRVVLMEVPGSPDRPHALVLQEQISRTGILTNTSFSLEHPTMLFPAQMTESPWTRYHNGSGSNGAFHLTPISASASAASGDWWLSRSEHAHLLTAVMPTRGRIEKTDAEATLVSSFDFPLESFFFLSADGQWHRANHISTGKPFALQPCQTRDALAAVEQVAGSLSLRNRLIFKEACKRRNHFFATTSSGPALPSLPSIRWSDTQTILTGAIQP